MIPPLPERSPSKLLRRVLKWYVILFIFIIIIDNNNNVIVLFIVELIDWLPRLWWCRRSWGRNSHFHGTFLPLLLLIPIVYIFVLKKVGGSKEAFERSKEYLQAMGKNLVHCGDQGTGQVAKICNNLVLGISMIGVSEAMNLGMFVMISFFSDVMFLEKRCTFLFLFLF